MNQPCVSNLPFRHVPASRGVTWWGDGWRSFLRAPWAWLGLSLAFLAVTLVLQTLPMSGLLTQWLNLPLLALGAVFASVLQRRWWRARSITPVGLAADPDNEGALGESSRHWASRMGPLLVASLLVIALVVLAGLVVVLLAGGLFGFGLMRPQALEQLFREPAMAMAAGMGLRIGVGLLIGLLVLLVLFLASTLLWFVGTLVALGGVGPWDAIGLSVRAALHNIGALMVFTLLLIPFGILAMIPMGLGLLVLLPVLSGASYASFDDVFGASPEAAPELT